MTRHHQKTIIVARRFGRLANRLTIFANLIAFAEARGCRIVNPTFHSYAHDFENLTGNFYCEYPLPVRTSLFDRVPVACNALRSGWLLYKCTRIVTRTARYVPVHGVVIADKLSGNEGPVESRTEVSRRGLEDGSIVLMSDWHFRVPKLAIQHAAVIRSFLRPVGRVEKEAVGAVEVLREGADLVIGVHIRQGDYETFKNGRYFFPIARYLVWMNELSRAFAPRSVAFLVCSDVALDERAFPDLAVGFGPGNAVGDLFALSACDRLIGPVSTFTQWASFYGNVPLYSLRDVDDQPIAESFAVSDLSEIP